MNLSLNFIRGMVASVNPCGFVLLPTYLFYFLGISSREGQAGAQRASLGRALTVSAAVSAGFMVVFVVIGLITDQLTTVLRDNAKYLTAVIGAAFVLLGVAMLFGYRLPITTPKLDAGGRDRTVRSMFVYGVAYAVASLGCTLPLFSSAVFLGASRRHGVLAGVANVASYGLGMALVVSVLTVTLAAANVGLLRFLRSSMKYVEMLAGAFVLLSGAYLLWYFYWVDLREDGDPISEAVQEYQTDATVFLNDHWRPVTLVGLVVIAAAVAHSMRQRVVRRGRGAGAG